MNHLFRIFLVVVFSSAILCTQPAHAGTTACTPSPGYDVCVQVTASGADQTWAVPAGVSEVNASLFGAGGGGVDTGYNYNYHGAPGAGGFSTGTVAVSNGTTLTLVVGRGGVRNSNAIAYGGGGAGGDTPAGFARGGGGGGMSAIFSTSSKTALTALIVAGGGGGASPGSDGNAGIGPGGGGGLVGLQDIWPTSSGRGGTQSAGGAAATGGTTTPSNNCSLIPTAGALFQGGAGGTVPPAATGGSREGGGGGGGGFYGGGGGLCQLLGLEQNGGGGGGSSYLSASVTGGSTTAGGTGFYNGALCSATSPSGTASGGASHDKYVAGVGVGTCNGNGGDGLIVIQYRLPRLTLSKQSVGGTGAFAFSYSRVTISGSTVTTSNVTPTITTTAINTPVATAEVILNATGSNYDITENNIPAGFQLTDFICADTNAANNGNSGSFGIVSTPNTPSLGGTTSGTVRIPAGKIKNTSILSCTVTNTRMPSIAFRQVTNGHQIGGIDSFNSAVNMGTPGGMGLTASPGAFDPASGYDAAVLVTALGSPASVRMLPNNGGWMVYSVTCLDANNAVTGQTGTLSATVVNPNLTNSRASPNPQATFPTSMLAAGAQLQCTITLENSIIEVVGITRGGITSPGWFSYTQTNIANNPATIGTTSQNTPFATGWVANPSITPDATTLSTYVNVLATNITVTEVMPGGANWVISSVNCIDRNASVSGNAANTNLATLSGATWTIPAANVKGGSRFLCTVTTDKNPANLVTVKTLASSTATPVVGGTVAYLITVTNNGPTDATTVALTDTLPTGLTATANNGTRVPSVGTTYSAATGLWTINSLASGASATLRLEGTVNAGSVGATVTNTTTAGTSASVYDPTTTGDDLSESVTISFGTVDTEVVKTSVVISDPVNGTTNPKAIPGAVVEYTITVRNKGTAVLDLNSMIMTDVLPVDVDMRVAAGGTPAITFVQGTPSSGLSLNWPSAVSWSNQPTGIAPFTYTPSPDGGGYDSAVRGFSIAFNGAMAAATGATPSSFSITYRARIR